MSEFLTPAFVSSTKAYYYRENQKNILIKEHVAKEFLKFRVWYVWEETDSMCIIAK